MPKINATTNSSILRDYCVIPDEYEVLTADITILNRTGNATLAFSMENRQTSELKISIGIANNLDLDWCNKAKQ